MYFCHEIYNALIASSIFAAAAVLIVGGFGLSTKYQREIRISRDVTQDARQVVQEIAKEVEYSYNGTLKVGAGLSSQLVTQNNNQVYNFAVLSSTSNNIVSQNMTPGSVLLIRSSDNHCRYYTLQPDPNFGNIKRIAVYIDRKEGCARPNFQGPYYLTDEKININNLEFRGVMNQKNQESQAYVWIIIDANNNTQISNYNIPMRTQTMATIRNYSREI